MKKLNPIEKSHYINERYKDYLRSSFHFENEKLQKLFYNELDKEKLFKGPYVNLNLPFRRGKSINQLVDEGIMSPIFVKLDNIDLNRPLYLHQEMAIRNINAGRGAIVTTGTGSGKTECFLFPILNDILKDIEKEIDYKGIRAIFLYPMNALVNDQIDRLRSILHNYPQITFGFYTGETPEKGGESVRKRLEEENGVKISQNELVSREEIRKNPPQLLFTNYSMLEYLLIRPKDFEIFDKKQLNNWHFVVLDEAHTYNGSLGIELSMLMRRLTALAEKKPRFILTSATLGEKGKSEKDIVTFGNNLTSSNFAINDIIFSNRIPLYESLLKFRLNGEIYIEIKENIDQIELINEIINPFLSKQYNEVKEALYDLLICDRNVFDVYNFLAQKSLSFDELSMKMKSYLTDDQLIALIDLVNLSEKNGIGIYDLKYHSFVRPLSGAYMTLDDDSKLSLTKTNFINNFKAFEVGNCRFCNAPFIIGKIIKKDNIDYLYQNQEIDIYENYGDNNSFSLDFFLLNQDIDEEEKENTELEECEICSICGQIHEKANIAAVSCDCDPVYKKVIYRIIEKSSRKITFLNNITSCPCCGHRSTSGVVKNLNLGKDEGTAIVAQILYESLEEKQDKVKKANQLSLSLKNRVKRNDEKTNVKQFLSFSDSRQQASFAATFFNSNHIRMLQKRLIWKVVEDHNYNDIKLEEVVSCLEHIIKTNNLFPNNSKEMNSYKNAWIAVLSELLRVDGDYDGEGLGLYYFDLDLSEILNEFTNEDVKEELSLYNIDKKDLETLIQVVLNSFKTVPAINYTKSTLTPEEKMEYLEYRRFDNYVQFKSEKVIKNIHSLIPVKGKNNKLVRYISKACNCTNEQAIDLIDLIFNQLAVEISIDQGMDALLLKHDSKEAYQVNSGKFILKNYRTCDYYQCQKCKRVTPYNVHDVCPNDKCTGKLIRVNPDDALKNNYYRNQYKNKKIESILIKEHTAQLSRKTAKQYQNDFKNKKINILSCSTTFEMGIDIGNLETVFMRNVPPTPANYVQRAGRAGRRKDSSAYILTFCGNNSHDYTYFCEPEKMISGIIIPPYFDVLNKKIIIRHLMATSLSFFFKKNPNYFTNIDNLVFKNGDIELKKFLSSKPKDLINFIDKKVIPESKYNEYHSFYWYETIGNDDEKMNNLVSSIKEMDEEYNSAKNGAILEDNLKEAAYYDRQIKRLHDLHVLDELSKYCVIPKYGFPVDVVDLKTYENGVVVDKYDLNRDLKIAISEYAPDSEIIVDGKKYTSKYITLPKTKEFPRNYFCECPTCKKINVSLSDRTIKTCSCGENLVMEHTNFFIEPSYGFKTGETKESTRMKPKKSYLGEVMYIGGGVKEDSKNILNDNLMVESSSNDELTVINRSDFYICPECGYSEIISRGHVYSKSSKEHLQANGYKCRNEDLSIIKIGHRFKTDVTRISIPFLSLSEVDGKAKALSFMYAFLEGMSIGLNIDRNDIDGLLQTNMETLSYDIILYDNVPGGAGHVKRIMNSASMLVVLKSALNKVSQNCCDEETTCYNCLRNYYNQKFHNKLKRKYAKDIILEFLNNI